MMQKRQKAGIILLLLWLPILMYGRETRKVDVLVVGGGASGVAAALQSSRMGMRVLVAEETTWLGGMLTAAGVSAIDGNEDLPAGIWGEFRERLARHYGGVSALATGWVSNVQFEPSVGNRIFHEMLNCESVEIWKESSVKQLHRHAGQWTVRIRVKGLGTQIVETPVVIDATELGDIAKLCGVRYDVGMESRLDTGEDVAPQKANGIVQDITYVAVLKDYGRDVTIKRPKGYNPADFNCCCINPLCVTPKEADRMWSSEKMMTYGKLPQDKYMINWPIEGNDYYVNLIDMSPRQRSKALRKAKLHTMRFVYFIQHELGYRNLGLADDEYPTKDRLPLIPYHRESRRIHGKVRFTLNHVTQPYTRPEPLYRTTIAVGDYPVDHHHTRYQGHEQLPNLYFYPIASFGLPLGTLIPKQTEGLIVAEKSISVSNIINGCTRLQPVVMQIGQAAGALAALAVKQGKQIDQVAVRDVQHEILAAKGYLLPFLDAALTDPEFVPYQHIGATGILKATGKSVDWKNETWLHADSMLIGTDLTGLYDVYPTWKEKGGSLCDSAMTLSQALALIAEIARAENISIAKDVHAICKAFGWERLTDNHVLSRGQMAVLIDQMLEPFRRKPIDIYGRYIP